MKASEVEKKNFESPDIFDNGQTIDIRREEKLK